MTEEQVEEIKNLICQIASNAKKETETKEITSETAIDILASSLNEFTRVMCSSVLKPYGLNYIDTETLLNLTVNRMYENAKCYDDCFPPCFYKLIDINRYIFDSCEDVSNLLIINYDDLYNISICAKWIIDHSYDNYYIDPYIFYRAIKILLYCYVDGMYLRDDISDNEKGNIKNNIHSLLKECDKDSILSIIDDLITFYTEKINSILDNSSSDNPSNIKKYKEMLNEFTQIKKDYLILLNE